MSLRQHGWKVLMEYVVSPIAGYLIGAIPFAFLAGKLVAGKDLRYEGTGNLGTSNVFHEVGKAAGVTVFFLDCAKMGLTLLVMRSLGLPLWAQSLAALAVIIGHNWSVFVGFKGGRGMAVTLVGAAILLPWETLIVLGILGIGTFTRTLALTCGIALIAWPLLAIWRGEPTSLVVFAVGACVLGFARRLQGSPEVAEEGPVPVRRRDVLISRLLFDREVQPPRSD